MKKALLLTLLLAGAGWAEEAAYVPARGYEAAALREIDGAKASVDLFLYLFSYHASQPGSPAAALADALVRARERGARVEVTLNGGRSGGDPDGGRSLTSPTRNSFAPSACRARTATPTGRI